MIPNMFPTYQQVECEDNTDPISGECKTVVFIFSTLLTLCLIAAFYWNTPVTLERKLNNPTYADFLEVAEFRPTCVCTKTGVRYATIATQDVTIDGACDALTYLRAGCLSEIAINSASTTSQYCKDIKGYYVLGSSLCEVAQQLLLKECIKFNQTTITSGLLLSETLITELIRQASGAKVDAVMMGIASQIFLTEAVNNADKPISWSQLDSSPPTTQTGSIGSYSFLLSCANDFEPASSNGPFCSFLKDFLYSTDASSWPMFKDPNSWGPPFNLSFAQELARRFGTSRWTTTTFANMAYSGFIYSNDTYDGFTTTVNYGEYFNACMPSQCTYTTVGMKSGIEIATTLISLIGGVTTLYRVFVAVLLPKMVGVCPCIKNQDARIRSMKSPSKEDKAKAPEQRSSIDHFVPESET